MHATQRLNERFNLLLTKEEFNRLKWHVFNRTKIIYKNKREQTIRQVIYRNHLIYCICDESLKRIITVYTKNMIFNSNYAIILR